MSATGAEQNNENITDIILHFFINMVLDHLSLSIQLQSFLEWTRTRFEQYIVEFYIVLLE
jgi:hypothetical protein